MMYKNYPYEKAAILEADLNIARGLHPLTHLAKSLLFPLINYQTQVGSCKSRFTGHKILYHHALENSISSDICKIHPVVEEKISCKYVNLVLGYLNTYLLLQWLPQYLVFLAPNLLDKLGI